MIEAVTTFKPFEFGEDKEPVCSDRISRYIGEFKMEANLKDSDTLRLVWDYINDAVTIGVDGFKKKRVEKYGNNRCPYLGHHLFIDDEWVNKVGLVVVIDQDEEEAIKEFFEYLATAVGLKLYLASMGL